MKGFDVPRIYYYSTNSSPCQPFTTIRMFFRNRGRPGDLVPLAGIIVVFVFVFLFVVVKKTFLVVEQVLPIFILQ